MSTYKTSEESRQATTGGEPGTTSRTRDNGAAGVSRRALLAARSIPYGQTRSYGWLAARAGSPAAARAAGQAMARNPIPLLIPCHRVLGAEGALTGFGGGLRTKRALLELEGVACDRTRVRPGARVQRGCCGKPRRSDT